jgi:hypothetical protein
MYSGTNNNQPASIDSLKGTVKCIVFQLKNDLFFR